MITEVVAYTIAISRSFPVEIGKVWERAEKLQKRRVIKKILTLVANVTSGRAYCAISRINNEISLQIYIYFFIKYTE